LLFVKISEAYKAISQIEASFQTVNSERIRITEPLSDLDRRYRSIPKRLDEALLELRRSVDDALLELMSQRESLDLADKRELGRIQSDLARRRMELFQRRTALQSRAQSEKDAALAGMRRLHIENFLKLHTIRHAVLSGIGTKLKDELALHCIVTAADIDSRIYSVKGIGIAKGEALAAWRRQIEWQANQSAPTSLPAYEAMQVAKQFTNQIQEVEQEINALARWEKKQQQEIATRFSQSRNDLIRQEEAAGANAERQAERIKAQFHNEKEQLAQKFEAEKTKAELIRKQLDAKLLGLSQSMFTKRADLHQLQREYDRHRSFTFGRYVGRVFGLRRAA
jgi:hypothetical protein